MIGAAFTLLLVGPLLPSTTPTGADGSPATEARAAQPSATPSPSPTPEDLADPDTVSVAVSSLVPAAVPTVDTDATLAGAGGQTAIATLTLLAVADPAEAAPYDRDLFGYRAFDIDRNGCDTRNDILRRDLTGIVVKPGTNGCVVLSGVLSDPYSATTMEFFRGAATSADVQIDHVVALADAWEHGASTWAEDQLHRFGNDPLNLLAVQGALNQQKSDANAAAWLPPNQAFGCPYVARQIAVKFGYALSVTSAERAAMAAVLSTCPDEPLPDGAVLPAPVTSAAQIAADQAAVVQAAADQAAADQAAAAQIVAAAQAAAAAAAAREQVAAPVQADLDPRFGTCKEAKANGYGPYYAGVDPEYDWYRDADSDGKNCER